MTSRSRKKRPTTARRTTSPGTGRSRGATIVALLVLGGLAPGADPWAPDAPAPTRWTPPPAGGLPAVPLMPPPEVGLPPLARPAGPGLPDPGFTSPGPERMVVLHKQPGATAPKEPGARSDRGDGTDLGKIDENARRFVRLPTKEEVFRLDADPKLQQEIIDRVRVLDRTEPSPEGAKREDKFRRFPDDPQLVPPGTRFVPRTAGLVPVKALIEPGFVVHRRLYFEEVNAERYGWDLGITQPVVSALVFYKDFLFWPAKLASVTRDRYDSNAGKCLPGSPVPLYVYPPQFDLFGAAVEGAFLTGIGAILQ